MFCETFCAAIQGIDGCMIQVEADVSDGLPCFSMVGFLASEVKEAKERVSIAIRNSGFRIPPKKITINLSPADFRKAGSCDRSSDFRCVRLLSAGISGGRYAFG